MSEIKRYYLQDEKRNSEPSWYVSADDHINAIRQLKERNAELVRERDKVARKSFIDGASWGAAHFLDETPEEAADRYIEQLKEQGK